MTPAAPYTDAVPPAPTNSDPVKVLLIEDNLEHAAFLQHLLQLSEAAASFQLEHVETLKLGFARLKLGGIGLIMLDLSLSDSEGMETFLLTMATAPDVPIVVLSGRNDVDLAVETVQLGAQDYLVKGHVDNQLLIRSMRYACERQRVQLQLRRAHDELERRVEERTSMLQQANVRLQKEIAERRRAEEGTREINHKLTETLGQLRAAQQEVILRERMHALGRMANGIAHDFNNTLAPILSLSELLLVKPEIAADPEAARSFIEKIHNAAKDSASVVSRLREFYRRRDENEIFAPVVVNELVQQVIAVTRPRWKDQALAAGVNISIRTELGEVPTVAGNEAELREAFANLLFNAIDAIKARGTITLRTEVQGSWVVITVIDDGVGMTEDVRTRCLEPFYSTKDVETPGLGLGSVYGIVRRHDGQLDIRSEPQRGTAISISLPLLKSPAAAEPPPFTVVQVEERPLRILVVEDEEMVREVISIYLAEDLHDVTLAENGREGLEKFRTGQFDLVLTDRAMPEMNGDQLAKEIKLVKPDQRLILLTGFGDLMNGAGEIPEGVDLVVGKPFTMNVLRDAIAKIRPR